MNKVYINNLSKSYRQEGSGPNLILLHGNAESSAIYEKHIEILKEHFTVYALDTRNHGESQNAKMSYDLFASDLIAFIDHLKIVKPLVFGFSDGGITALLVAMKQPKCILAAICCGINLSPKDLKVTYRIIFGLAEIFHVKKRAFYKLMLDEPNIKPKEVSNIKVPIYLYYGAKDIVSKTRCCKIFESIKGSKIEILPNHNHASYVLDSATACKIILGCYSKLTK